MATVQHSPAAKARPALGIVLCGLAALLLSGCRLAGFGQNVEGVRMYQQGQYQGALQQFQRAVASDPENSDSYYNLAATFHRMGAARGDEQMLQQAEQLYNQCLDYESNHVECRRGLAVLLAETGRSDKAFTMLKNWSLGDPTCSDARVELARLYQEFGDTETAKLHLQTALQSDEHNARAWSALAQLREEDGQYEQALANYQRSYNLNNFQPAVAARIADLSRSVSGGLGATSSGNTRLVQPPPNTSRY